MNITKCLLASLVAALGLISVAPAMAQGGPERHKSCHFDRHHHRSCHWVK
jgi:hypothetical protein